MARWLGLMLLSGVLAWAGYVTTSLNTDRITLDTMIDRLARIETKLDMIMDRATPK